MICDVVHIERGVYEKIVQKLKRYDEMSNERLRVIIDKKQMDKVNKAAWDRAVARKKNHE